MSNVQVYNIKRLIDSPSLSWSKDINGQVQGNVTALPNGVTAVTQILGDTSTLVATNQFVASAISAPGAVRWSAIGNALADLVLANAGFNTTFNQTSATAWLWANTTAATNLVNTASPLLELSAAYFTLGASATDLWTIQNSVAAPHTSATVTNVSETVGSLVTLTITGGNFVLASNGFSNTDTVTFTGLTQATWLNGQTVGLITASATSLTFNDPTSHGTQASHAETGQVTQANPISTLAITHSGSSQAQVQLFPTGTAFVVSNNTTNNMGVLQVNEDNSGQAHPGIVCRTVGTTAFGLKTFGTAGSGNGPSMLSVSAYLGLVAVCGSSNGTLGMSPASSNFVTGTAIGIWAGNSLGWSSLINSGNGISDISMARFAVGTLGLSATSVPGIGGALVLTNLTAANIVGTINIAALTTPAAPVITHASGNAAATWGYKIVAKDVNGKVTAASAEGQITNGAATLTPNVRNFVTITPVAGAASYDVYRVTVGTSPTTTGLLANFSANQIGSFGLPQGFNDIGNLTLTGAGNASGGNTVYSGGSQGIFSNAVPQYSLVGFTFVITGFVNAANNGTFLCVASNNQGITLANASGVAETHAGNAATFGDGTTAPTVNTTGPLLQFGGDTGISRLGPASLAIGNGTAGDLSGTLAATDLWGKGVQVGGSANNSTGVNQLQMYDAGNAFVLQIFASGPTQRMSSTFNMAWTAGAANAAADSNISRLGAASLAIGNGAAGDVTGKLTLAQLILSAPQSPASNAAGTAGELAYDSGFIYVCIASGNWGRATLATGY